MRLQSTPSRPLVSLVLFTYNQQQFVEEAVRAALRQTYQPLEIIISDDASRDATFNIVKTLVADYHGPHLVTASVNAENLGINAHINTAVRKARGAFIVVAAGDDVSLPDRVERLVERWGSGVSGVFSNARIIDVEGRQKDIFVRPGYRNMMGWKEMVLAGTHGAWGCTLSWASAVFETFGDMPADILGEDAVIPFRCGLMSGLAYLDEPLVYYRDHGENVSWWVREKQLTKAEIVDLGSRIMRYKEQMYNNWQADLAVARDKNLITAEEHAWGGRVLSENILLVREMDELLRVPVFRLAYLLPAAWFRFSRRLFGAVSPPVALTKTAWKLLNGVIHYRAPGTHQLIRRMLGRNT